MSSNQELSMDTTFIQKAQELYEQAELIITDFYQSKRQNENSKLNITQEFEAEFFSLVDKVNVSLMEDKDNFFGFFLLQMAREIRFDLSSPTAVNFKNANYVIYFDPLIFLNLTLQQMATTIKHEILHILSLHLLRAKRFKNSCSTLSLNLAMDIIVNTYLDYLPPYAVTLEWVNYKYSLKLLPFKPFEYYVTEIQTALDLLEADQESAEENDQDEADNPYNHEADSDRDNSIKTAYDPEKAHDLWEESSEMDAKTLKDFTEKFIDNAQKGSIPNYLEGLISSLKSSKGELPWNLYLKRLMGTVESNRKKTVSRRSRRQPERLDLRGELRSHKAKILVALDISGSISDGEFHQAIKEVLAIVKNYHHEITIVECDNEIRRVYRVRTPKDIKPRLNIRGGTRFTPVFDYGNQQKLNLLIYFTDGQGEEKLQAIPRGYKTLWVISGSGEKLSLKEPYGAVKKLQPIALNDEALTLTMSDVKKEGYSMNDQEGMHI